MHLDCVLVNRFIQLHHHHIGGTGVVRCFSTGDQVPERIVVMALGERNLSRTLFHGRILTLLTRSSIPSSQIYGEVYAGSIDPPCLPSEPDAPQCMPFHWVTPITMTAYLIFCNILLLSILIATFNNTYIRISKSSDQVWKYHRYYIVLKYESKPMLPPPLILLSHIYLLIKLIIRQCRGKKFKVDQGLST